eukprot:1510789-Heterocapsa_arctica.AAC.1
MFGNKALRRELFYFLAHSQAFGKKVQMQGVPLELDAVTAATSSTRPWLRPLPGKSKVGGPSKTPTGRWRNTLFAMGQNAKRLHSSILNIAASEHSTS